MSVNSVLDLNALELPLRKTVHINHDMSKGDIFDIELIFFSTLKLFRHVCKVDPNSKNVLKNNLKNLKLNLIHKISYVMYGHVIHFS